jgi:hypothetical protein
MARKSRLVGRGSDVDEEKRKVDEDELIWMALGPDGLGILYFTYSILPRYKCTT